MPFEVLFIIMIGATEYKCVRGMEAIPYDSGNGNSAVSSLSRWYNTTLSHIFRFCDLINNVKLNVVKWTKPFGKRRKCHNKLS